jgi:hypothetical protein
MDTHSPLRPDELSHSTTDDAFLCLRSGAAILHCSAKQPRSEILWARTCLVHRLPFCRAVRQLKPRTWWRLASMAYTPPFYSQRETCHVRAPSQVENCADPKICKTFGFILTCLTSKEGAALISKKSMYCHLVRFIEAVTI